MTRTLVPRSLFARTALLITATFTLYAVMALIVMLWAVIAPAAHNSGHQLAQRVQAWVKASEQGGPFPEGVTPIRQSREPESARFSGFAFSYYLDTVRREIQAELPGTRAIIVRAAGPTEIWVRTPRLPEQWLRLTWEITRPEAPLAALIMLIAGAALALAAAGVQARRLSRPLAALAAAADQIARGDRVAIDTHSGPDEVRSLASAFQSMSQRLAELEGQRELMLAGVSHDLRTPLARMRVAAELLDERDSILAREMTRDIEEMDRMIGQFLRYVRSNYRETPVPAVPDEVLRSALASYQGDERLVFDLSAGVACVIPAQSIHHIVVNIVQNALDYGRSPVIVRSSIMESHLVLSVLDSGAGLSSEEWQRAIRPFERLATTADSGHSGLGLAMVDRLVSACSGRWSGVCTESGFIVQMWIPVRMTAVNGGPFLSQG